MPSAMAPDADASTGVLSHTPSQMTEATPRAVGPGAILMMSHWFLDNAIFFTCTLVLTRFYEVSAILAPDFLTAFAAGNLAGPLYPGPALRHLGRTR